jgi:hypothetical protein
LRVCRWDRENGQAWVFPLQTSAARRVEKRTLRQIRCAVYYKSSDREFEFRVVECEESEDEVIPIENSRSVALQCVGHSLKDANTGCSRASASFCTSRRIPSRLPQPEQRSCSRGHSISRTKTPSFWWQSTVEKCEQPNARHNCFVGNSAP